MKILMAGTGTFAEPIFESLMKFSPIGLITQPDPVNFHKRGSTRQSEKGVKFLAEQKNIPVLQPEDVNSKDFIETVKKLNPDLVVVAAYGQIFSKDFLDSCKLVLNVHGSLLPKYRGAAPVAHAILNGDVVTGVTVIKIDSGIDSGDICAYRFEKIESTDTTGSLESKLSISGAELMIYLVEKLNSEDKITFKKQNKEHATKAPRIKKEFGLIDWNKPAEYVCRHIRAMQPWPTAYTFVYQEGKEPVRASIVEASVVNRWPTIEKPGDIFVYDDKQIWVTTSDYYVQINAIHPAGKKAMTSEEYLRGLKSRILRMGK